MNTKETSNITVQHCPKYAIFYRGKTCKVKTVKTKRVENTFIVPCYTREIRLLYKIKSHDDL